MKHFLQSESGAISVNYVMWLPIILIILSAGVDGALLLTKQSHLFDVNRDITRQVVLGNFQDVDDVQHFLDLVWPGVETQVVGLERRPSTAAGAGNTIYIGVEIAMPYSEILIFGDLFAGDTMLHSRFFMSADRATFTGPPPNARRFGI